MALVLEFILEVFGELLLEVFAASVGDAWHRRRGKSATALSALGFLMVGVGVGLLSLWVAPHSLVQQQWLRVLNVLVAPIAGGAVLGTVGFAQGGAFRWGSAVHGAALAFGSTLTRFVAQSL